MRIGIVAGESSGDQLAAGLIQAIKSRIPEASFTGVAGPQMIEVGCRALYPVEKLSVMGLVEVLGHFRELLGIRKKLFQYFSANPPDVFIGVDAPDFNLPLERKLKEAGIPTVHYVSPTVWAWRQSRVKSIAKSVDLMLTLFPFEADFYREHDVPVKFVGHPMADLIPMNSDKTLAREQLNLPQDREIIALLPGSRVSELKHHSQTMIATAQWCLEHRSWLRFVAPMATKKTRKIFEHTLSQINPQLPITIIDGQSREAMMASDAILLASGTAAHEALLIKRPFVVMYKMATISYLIMRAMIKSPYISMPNMLAGREVAPEFIQHQAQPEKIGKVLIDYLEHPEKAEALNEVFSDIHETLRQDANTSAADAVLALCHTPT